MKTHIFYLFSGTSCGILYKTKQVHCEDNSECVFEHNLCDGSSQCPDGSDEREDFCTGAAKHNTYA